jgi:uncharacterized membrane protein
MDLARKPGHLDSSAKWHQCILLQNDIEVLVGIHLELDNAIRVMNMIFSNLTLLQVPVEKTVTEK